MSNPNMNDLRKKIESAINSASAENGSDTPDFILAEYLTDCLTAYDKAVVSREKWYGRPELPNPTNKRKITFNKKILIKDTQPNL